MTRQPPRSTLFPYTTSSDLDGGDRTVVENIDGAGGQRGRSETDRGVDGEGVMLGDRKSTRLNSSHRCISYAVFCLKKKTKHWGGLGRFCTRKGSNRYGYLSA